MSELAMSGSWGYKYLVSIEQVDEDVSVKYVRQMFV
jgi:hypothetical protein